MTLHILRCGIFAGALVAASLASGEPGEAQGINRILTVEQIQDATPRCRDHPDFKWAGYVSGILSGIPSQGVAFAGCFPTRAACERWRGPVSGYITGRLILNECRPRA